mgnify:CR=1 FL=1
MSQDPDFLVLGSGIAGLSFALKVASHGSVAIITKKNKAESNTNYAQGGIAAVMAADDEPELHVRDTLRAGAGLCHEAVVRALVAEGPARVRELMEWGTRFRREGEAQAVRIAAPGRGGCHRHHGSHLRAPNVDAPTNLRAARVMMRSQLKVP